MDMAALMKQMGGMGMGGAGGPGGMGMGGGDSDEDEEDEAEGEPAVAEDGLADLDGKAEADQ